MRRLAPLLLLVLAAFAVARDSTSYLKARAARGIVQAASPSALRELATPRVLELSGKPKGTCQIGDTTVLVLEFPDGQSQEIQAKAMPEWLANATGAVRVLVRCERGAGGLKATLLAAAPELDVLPAEEAYWRREAEKRKLAEARASKPAASRHSDFPERGSLFGPIGRGSFRRTVVPVSRIAPFYAAYIQGRNPRLTPDKAMGIANDLIRFSAYYGVEPQLVVAILLVESGFDPNAVSHSGAVGLGQLMPETARWMGVHDSYDTTQNLYGMIKLLNTHMRQFNRPADDPLVLAAYNAGEGAVRRHRGVPPYRETQAYVQRVTAYFHKLRGY